MEHLAKLVIEHDLLNLTEAELGAFSSEEGFAPFGSAAGALYPRSLTRVGPALLAMVRLPLSRSRAFTVSGPAGGGASVKRLVAFSAEPLRLGFQGPKGQTGGVYYQEAAPVPYNVGPLWELLPWTRPVSLRSHRTTVGMGDRIGMASAAHIRAARDYRVSPVLAQQSIRELDFTGRSFVEVVCDAAFMVFEEGFRSGYGADGDHLKTIPDIDRALAAGMPMVTLDLSEVMRPEVASLSDAEVEAAFARLPSEYRRRVEDSCAGRAVELETCSITLDAGTARRCAVMYGEALSFAERVDAHLRRRTGGEYDLEVSVDETTTPTLPEHHYFIARELEVRGVAVNSLAPRFVGEFQKAIDYIGDEGEFTAQLRRHAEVARRTGGYKISVHSGSDKFSVYPAVGRETGLRLHLKTSGTSWLESLRAVARTEPALYREMHRRALEYFTVARAAYHVAAEPSAVAPLDATGDDELAGYLSDPNCRQLLHICYGGLLRDPQLRDRYFEALHANEQTHYGYVEAHMRRHLELLGAGRRAPEQHQHPRNRS